MITVKQHDVDDITFTVNMDLTGWDVRLLARRLNSQVALELDHTVDGGTVTHTLTGELDVGVYQVEVEASRDGQRITFPTPQDGSPPYELLQVLRDLG